MFLKTLLLSIVLYHAASGYYSCNLKSALLLTQRSSYTFSRKLLLRVAEETDEHFVFSPLSTWLQLSALGEGTTGRTRAELWRVTNQHKNKCFRRKLGPIVRSIWRDLKWQSTRKSIIAIEAMMDVKHSFVKNVKNMYDVDVMQLNFYNRRRAADKVNKVIYNATHGLVTELLYDSDFLNSVLLLSDSSYFKSAWKYPFDPALTKKELFAAKNVIGNVQMMNRVGYYNVKEMKSINATILELPCENSRFSMLVFLPLHEIWAGDLFNTIRRIRLSSIFNTFSREGFKLVNVKLPKFRIKTTIDNLPELMYDMGVRRIFYPDLAEMGGMSKYKMFTSLLTQTADIEVSERGVTASSTPAFLMNDTIDNQIDFIANKTFVYMIVDRYNSFILFAGIYSTPSEYFN